MKKILHLFSAALGLFAGQLTNANASTIVSNDVTATLWPGGAPFAFFDTAALGGGDINLTTNALFERNFGALEVGPLGSQIVIRGMGWAAANNGHTATNIIATFTYLGANGTNGGGDDVVIGVVSNAYARAATAAEYVWVFDSPLTNIIDGLSNRFAINLYAGGENGTNLFRCKTTGTLAQPLSAAKLSIAGSSKALKPFDPLDRYWVGNLSATWDTATANWTDTVSAVAYANGTLVTLDDTLDSVALNTNITLAATHSPSNVVVFNDVYDYSLSGGSLAGGMTLKKQGGKALTLGMANSYTGGSLLAGGKLRLADANGLGVGAITFNGGGLSSDGTTARTVTNAIGYAGSTSTFGDAVNNGRLTLSGPVDYAGLGVNKSCDSDVVFTGSQTNGGLNQKWGNGLLIYSNVVGTVTGGGSQWQIAWGDVVVDGGSLGKSGGGIRIGSTAANGVSRLVITNGGQVLMTGSGQNARVGNDQAPNPAVATSTNILDVSGTLAWSPGATAGAIFMGPNGALAEVNLRPGGLLRIGRFLKSGATTFAEVNFLGGTLAAANDSTIFMTNLGAANINTAAGAIIDSGVYNITIAQSLSDPFSSGGGVIKKGSGTLNFTGGGSYSGATVVQEGTLLIGSSHPASSPVIVSNNAAIGAAISSPANVTSLALNDSRVKADYGNGGSGTAITVGSSLNVSGVNVVELSGINLALGTYAVIDYSAGAKSGAGSFSAVPILPPGVSGFVTDASGLVQVTITATVTTKTWYGYDNGTFSIATNWNTTDSAWDFGLATYADGQAVLFDDTRFGGDNTNINIAATVSPVAVTVNNGSSTYSFNSDSGAGIAGSAVLIKTGIGRLDINTVNTYSGTTTVSGGGTLGGTGVISGPVSIGVVATLAPGTSMVTNRIGILTISNSLALNGNVAIDLDKSAVQSNDVVNVTGALSYGGTLTPVNVGTNALVAGDSFAVFPAGGTGSISVIGSPGGGLNWNFNTASGVLSVVSSTLSPAPLNYTNLGGGVAQFSWTGAFKLQWQTNAASVGLKTNWVDYPITTNPVNVTNNPVVPATFFRLINL